MALKVAINGFGRIGRPFFRMAFGDPALEIVAINGRSDAKTFAHLLKYDSTHGRYAKDVQWEEGFLLVEGKKIAVLSENELSALPWKEMGVDIVIESTGIYNDALKAKGHLDAGAKKVIIAAPAKNEDATLVYGINHTDYDPAKHHIVSNASCTTNCLAPVAKLINDNFGIVKGLMTTVHAYTNDQKILDKTHKDLRRARAAAVSIIPTTTGAAKAVSLVLPELKGKLNGFALRVPTNNVSVVDLNVELEKKTTLEEVNSLFKKASENQFKGILDYCDEPLVSIDFNGDSHSSIIDALSTMVIGDNMLKVVAWYDNEWGYTCRIVDLAKYIGSKL